MERSATVKDFLTIVFKYKYRIIVLFSFIVATVTIFTYVYPFTYEASAKILVKFDRNELSVSGSANSSNSSIIMRDSQREVLSKGSEELMG